ncbi:MAG: VCBS repeat-containing protein [Planctomycetes bacterium]|nr:VCBS repeat-containing protein [Planctomycetota bacterium]
MNTNSRNVLRSTLGLALLAVPLAAQEQIVGTYVPSAMRGAGGTPARASAVAFGDMSGDGLPDLVTVESSTGWVAVFDNDGLGGFPYGSTASGIVTNAWDVVTVDLDGLFRRDVAVTQRGGTNQVMIGLSTSASGAYTAPTTATFATSGDPIQILEFDVDGDGDRDLAVLSRSTNAIDILRNDGFIFGVFTMTSSALALPGSATPNAFATGDFNGDGLPDLAVVYAGVGNGEIYLNTTATRDGSSTPSWRAPLPVTPGTNPVAVTTGDFDGDGFDDLAAVNADSRDISVLLNRGTATVGWPATVDFTTTPPVILPPGAVPSAIVSGDTNGDGSRDLAITMSPSPWWPGVNFVIYANNGSGAFPMNAGYATGPGPVDLAVADIDGDLDLDFATADSNGSTVSPRQDFTMLRKDGPIGCCCHEFVAGVNDSFAAGPAAVEVACPRVPLAAWLGAGRRQFDGPPGAFTGFAHTFTQLPDRIVTAELTLSVLVDGANNLADEILLAWDGGAAGPLCWRIPLSQIIAPVGTTISGTATIDLGSLPGGLDLRPWLDAGRALDVAIGANTFVDHLHLHLVTSCPSFLPGPSKTDMLGLDSTPLVSGSTATFTISNAPPFGIAAMLLGVGVGCTPFPGFCIDPLVADFGVVLVPSSGTANVTVNIPSLPACPMVHLQAVSLDPSNSTYKWSCTLSEYVF